MNSKWKDVEQKRELEGRRSVFYTKGCQDLQDSLKYLYSLLKTQLVNIIYRLNRSIEYASKRVNIEIYIH
jgi:hypothetical protein